MKTNVPPGYYEANQGQVVTTGQPPGQYVTQGQGQPAMYSQQPGQPMMMYSQPQYNQQMMQYNIRMVQQIPVRWMERPTVPGCPPGLEYLTHIDQLLVKQRIDLFEVLTGYEVRNKYDIKNALGQTVYFAKEETDCCELCWCANHRRFRIHIYDNTDQEVIEVKRQDRCKLRNCVRDLIKVESPPGTVVGYVKQKPFSGVIHYTIMDADEHTVLKIVGPSCCYCYCPGDDIPFKVMSADGHVEVGRISRQWTNLIQEYFTDADNFGIQFPIDLDVKIKAVVLGAVFLIDFNFFEGHNKRRNQVYYQ